MRVQAGNVLGLDSEIGILAAPLRPGDRDARLLTRAACTFQGRASCSSPTAALTF